jgi:hypothetical protein
MKSSGILVGILVFLFVLLVISSAVSAEEQTLAFQEGNGGVYSNTQVVDVGWTPTEVTNISGPTVTVSVELIIFDYTPGRRILLRFPDIIGDGPGRIPQGSAIKAASLQLTRVGAGSHGLLYKVTSAWDENTVTGANTPGYEYPGTMGSVPAGTAGKAEIVQVNGVVQEWASGTPNWGIIIVAGYSATEFAESFYSDDAASVGQRPLLTVTFTPPLTPVEPSTWGKVKALYR